ncbi:repeat-containing lipoprotein, putative [Geotalea daltonii FRC-32]|uniref:Repeat-containing lipoprotein, putative n=2 Tax=Geotalea TaxID=2910589 RepID=B9M4E1_GEODF|nr:repeat-containing lipoprotein, putative [Geotalea daltonii FRC-32]
MRRIFIRTALAAAIVSALSLGGCGSNQNGISTIQMGGAKQGNLLTLTGTVSVLAGQAPQMGTADGTGSAARFNAPSGITTDGTNLYVADTGNNLIRKVVITTGAVTTLAGTVGTGTAQTSGSTDGTGSAAKFNAPFAITTDGTNLYVADTNNNTIRKVVIATGTVTTLAGSVGIPGSADGIGPAGLFNSPGGITTDGTNLYVSDTGNRTIRKVVIATGAVTTLAGSAGTPGSTDGVGPSALFGTVFGITTDGTSLFVADTDNSTIRKIVIATGMVTTLAGSAGVSGIADGTGSTAKFNAPFGITTDGTNLYVTDSRQGSIRKVAIATGVVTTLVNGSSLTTISPLNFPLGISTDGLNLYVADTDNSTIDLIK